jgi:Leucine-rich repeat (LRR) protein
MSVARRITPASIPPDWIVTFPAAELSLETLNISKVPALADNVGRLLPSALAGEEAYMPPQGLIIDEIDREPVVLRGGHQLVCTERDKNLTPRLASEGTDDDDDYAAAAAAAAVAAAKVSGTPCVSLRLANNHILNVDAHAFKNIPHLRALDLSTNHLEKLTLSPESTPWLVSLSLRNNRLSELGSLDPASLGGVLRYLDVSYNRLTSLSGVGQLRRLRVLVASGNQIRGELPRELTELRWLSLLDLSHNQLDGERMQPLGGLARLSTLRLAHNQLPSRALPALSMVLGTLGLRRLELFSNPLALDPSFPEVKTSSP